MRLSVNLNTEGAADSNLLCAQSIYIPATTKTRFATFDDIAFLELWPEVDIRSNLWDWNWGSLLILVGDVDCILISLNSHVMKDAKESVADCRPVFPV